MECGKLTAKLRDAVTALSEALKDIHDIKIIDNKISRVYIEKAEAQQ